MEFIEAKYDYTSNVADLEEEIFSKVIDTNNIVNETVSKFSGKLKDTKADVRQIISQRLAIQKSSFR